MSCVENGTNTKIDGSNQPNTIFVVATDTSHNNPGATLIDANVLASARCKFVMRSDAGATTYIYAGGPIVNGDSTANTGNWFIYTLCFNGASSFIRTNGVLMASGTLPAQKFAWPVLGCDAVDNPGTAAYQGKVWAVLFYSGSSGMSTNDIISVERALNCQGGLGYTIPGP